MSIFSLPVVGPDPIFGVPGQDNIFYFTPATLQPTDVVVGVVGGAFKDVMDMTVAGTVTAGQFVGVSQMEALVLPNGTNSITITPPTGNLFFRLKQ